MTYEYPNHPNQPDLDLLKVNILTSEMVDKSLDYLRWDEDIATISCVFISELSESDKSILDILVGAA